jgi:hypothetical protein
MYRYMPWLGDAYPGGRRSAGGCLLRIAAFRIGLLLMMIDVGLYLGSGLIYYILSIQYKLINICRITIIHAIAMLINHHFHTFISLRLIHTFLSLYA